MQKKRWNRYAIFLPYLFALIIFLLLYRYSFPQGDDFTFATRGGTLPRIWNYYTYYYTYAGARMSNVFASILLLTGVSVWRILTPLVMVGTSLLLFYCVTGRIQPRENQLARDFSLAFVCAFFPGLIPLAYHLFADTFLWMDGSCNYLYPLFFFLLGFLPFWNALRERPLPNALKWICPFFLLAAGLMHEQMTVALFVFCAASLIRLRIERRTSPYLNIVFGITIVLMIFTFTCPGAYYRLRETGGSKLPLAHRLFRNFLAYFSQFSNAMWIFAFLLGLCALYLLRHARGKFANCLKFFIVTGVVVAPLTQVFPFLTLQSSPSHAGLRVALLLLYWVLFFFSLFPAFLLASHTNTAYRYAPAFYLGIIGSQAIPIVVGSTGRPLLPLAVLVILFVLCVADEIPHKLITFAQVCTAIVGFYTIAVAISPAASNYAAYRNIEKQVSDAKSGKTKTVYFDQREMNSNYCYFNAFSSAYHYDLQQYYRLDKKVDLIFSAKPKK